MERQLYSHADLVADRIQFMIWDLERLVHYMPTLPEKSDADEALRALRHLRKQLEGS